MRHCKTAVQKCGGSSKSVIPIACGNSVGTRIVSSNTWANGESANWKQDYYKYKGFTFADILKRKMKVSAGMTKVGSNQEVTLTNACGTQADCQKGEMVSHKTKGRNDGKKSPYQQQHPR